MERSDFFLITGCSGGGKSTLLAALEASGARVVREAGREIVRRQIDASGPGTPWRDPRLFRELLLSRAIEDFEAADRAFDMRAGPVFFDRGIIDPIAWGQSMGLEPEPRRARALSEYRYARTVFAAPPWPELFHSDSERRSDWREAVAEYEACMTLCTSLGYDIAVLPKAGVEERVRFVLGRAVQAD